MWDSFVSAGMREDRLKPYLSLSLTRAREASKTSRHNRLSSSRMGGRSFLRPRGCVASSKNHRGHHPPSLLFRRCRSCAAVSWFRVRRRQRQGRRAQLRHVDRLLAHARRQENVVAHLLAAAPQSPQETNPSTCQIERVKAAHIPESHVNRPRATFRRRRGVWWDGAVTQDEHVHHVIARVRTG